MMQIYGEFTGSGVSIVRDDCSVFSIQRIVRCTLLLMFFALFAREELSAEDFIGEQMMGDMFYAADDYFGEDADIAYSDSVTPKGTKKDTQTEASAEPESADDDDSTDVSPARSSDSSNDDTGNDDADGDDGGGGGDDGGGDDNDDDDTPDPVDPPIYIPPPGGG